MQRKRVSRRKAATTYPRSVFVDAGQVASLLGVARNTVLKMTREGRFPVPCVRSGIRFMRWRRDVVQRWLSELSGPAGNCPVLADELPARAIGDGPSFVLTVSA